MGFRYIKCHNMKLNDKGVAVSNKDNLAILTPHVEAENYEPVNSQLQHRATIAEPAIWFQATSQRVSCFYDPDGEYIGPTNPSIRALIHDNTDSDYFWFLSTWLNWDRISEWFTGRFSGESAEAKISISIQIKYGKFRYPVVQVSLILSGRTNIRPLL